MSGLTGYSDEHLRALGSLVVEAGTLEHLVFDFVLKRARISRLLANVLMGRDNFDAMLSRLGRLIAAADDVEKVAKTQFKDWSNQADSAMRKRNEFFHSSWSVPKVDDGSVLRFVFSRAAVNAIPVQTTTTREIEELVDQITTLSAELFWMAEELEVGKIT